MLVDELTIIKCRITGLTSVYHSYYINVLVNAYVVAAKTLMFIFLFNLHKTLTTSVQNGGNFIPQTYTGKSSAKVNDKHVTITLPVLWQPHLSSEPQLHHTSVSAENTNLCFVTAEASVP